MEISHLRVFLAVAEELHFGRAAERLRMAQPPVSRIVAQLEKSLDTRLFERSTRSVRLTATGAELVIAAREVLASLEHARDRVNAAKGGETGHVDIAFATASSHGLVGELTRELRRRHPGIVPTLESQNLGLSALGRVMRGEVDAAFGRWDLVPMEVGTRVIIEESLVLAVPAEHPLAGTDEVSIAQLAAEPLISLPADHGSVLQDRLLRLCYAAGFDPDITQTAPDTWTALALVGAGLGCTLTLDSVQRNVVDPHVKFLRVRDRYEPFQLRLAWLPGNRNPALSRLLEVAEHLWPDAESITRK